MNERIPEGLYTVLVIDDEVGEAGSLQQKAFLRNYKELPLNFLFENCWTEEGYTAEKALQVVGREDETSLVLLDLKFGPDDELLGFDILRALSARYPSLPILVMSSVSRDVEMLGRCLEEGAVGFLEKHRSPAYLHRAVTQAIELVNSHLLLGQSAPLRQLRRQAARLSPYDQIPVLILGERGTGKERVARYIHNSGPRSQGPFIPVNCAGVPISLFEAEFFGAEKGAYTGASKKRIGYIEQAHGGTLFLDEVGTLPREMQAKLLRVLQERIFTRLGSSGSEVQSNFQLLSATNSDAETLLRDGGLREDFYDRIAAVTIHTPSLRNCREDITLLAEYFMERLVGIKKSLTGEVLGALREYSWPGNVRELQRVIQEAVVLSEDSPTVELPHLPNRLLTDNRIGFFLEEEFAGRSEPDWEKRRIVAELQIALEAKKVVKEYKGKHWKAEFMRLVYPHCKAQNAKGFADLIRRLTKGPWGHPDVQTNSEITKLLESLKS